MLKKPVLVTENVGMKDIIKKYIKNSENYIINPANINELSKKIFELSKNRTKLRHDGELFFEAAKKYLEKISLKDIQICKMKNYELINYKKINCFCGKK